MRPAKIAQFCNVSGWLALCLSLYLFSVGAVAQTPDPAIYAFSRRPDCGFADAPFVSDAGGNLYNTAFNGGANNDGCVFKLSRNSGGWQETVLYSFSGIDGSRPSAALVFDKLGDLYGTTAGGGLMAQGWFSS